MNPCTAKNASQSSCVCVLGHSHSAAESRQLAAHTTANAKAHPNPAGQAGRRAAGQDCLAWEPTRRGSAVAFCGLHFMAKAKADEFSICLQLQLPLLLLLLTLGVRISRRFGARVARVESECIQIHLESFTIDHHQYSTHSPLDPNAAAENASDLTDRESRSKNKGKDKQTNRQIDRQADRQTGRQTVCRKLSLDCTGSRKYLVLFFT